MQLLTHQPLQMWPGGHCCDALICSAPIAGVTQELEDDAAAHYGGKWFIGESMTESAMKIIASKFGAVYLSWEERPWPNKMVLSSIQVGLRWGTCFFGDAVVVRSDIHQRVANATATITYKARRENG